MFYVFAVLCCSKSRASLGAFLPEGSLGRDGGPSPPLTRRSRMPTRQRASLSAAIPKLSISDEGESNETEFTGLYFFYISTSSIFFFLTLAFLAFVPQHKENNIVLAKIG